MALRSGREVKLLLWSILILRINIGVVRFIEIARKFDPWIHLWLDNQGPFGGVKLFFPKKLKPKQEEAFIKDVLAEGFGEGVTFPVFG